MFNHKLSINCSVFFLIEKSNSVNRVSDEKRYGFQEMIQNIRIKINAICRYVWPPLPVSNENNNLDNQIIVFIGPCCYFHCSLALDHCFNFRTLSLSFINLHNLTIKNVSTNELKFIVQLSIIYLEAFPNKMVVIKLPISLKSET